MKKKIKIILISIFLIAAPLLMFAQNPPHPNGGNNPGGGNIPVGGSPSPLGAPTGNGIYLLLAMGAAYGALKLYQMSGTTLVTE